MKRNMNCSGRPRINCMIVFIINAMMKPHIPPSLLVLNRNNGMPKFTAIIKRIRPKEYREAQSGAPLS